jgi:hypothetical protein
MSHPVKEQVVASESKWRSNRPGPHPKSRTDFPANNQSEGKAASNASRRATPPRTNSASISVIGPRRRGTRCINGNGGIGMVDAPTSSFFHKDPTASQPRQATRPLATSHQRPGTTARPLRAPCHRKYASKAKGVVAALNETRKPLPVAGGKLTDRRPLRPLVSLPGCWLWYASVHVAPPSEVV